MRQIVVEETNYCSQEKRCIRSDGSTIWIQLTAFVVKQYSGEISHLTVVIEDIGDRKRQELSQLEERMQQIKCRVGFASPYPQLNLFVAIIYLIGISSSREQTKAR